MNIAKQDGKKITCSIIICSIKMRGKSDVVPTSNVRHIINARSVVCSVKLEENSNKVDATCTVLASFSGLSND